MNIWKTLNIQPTRDLLVIDSAYASAIRTVDEAADPNRYEEIRIAYEYALDYANTEYSYDAEAELDKVGQATSQHSYTQSTPRAEPLPSNVIQFDGPFRKPESPPKQQSSVYSSTNQDIQQLYELLHRDQKEAVEYLRYLLSSPYYRSPLNQEKLEKEVLYLLYKVEPFPYYFASEAEIIFEWNIYDNPFKNNYQLGFVFTSVLRKIARQRLREHISIHYFRNKNANHPSWNDVEKVLFGPFDENKLLYLVQGNNLYDGIGFLLDFIDKQNYHPDELPVHSHLLEWWRAYKASPVNTNNKHSISNTKKTSLIALSIIFVVLIAQAIVFNLDLIPTQLDFTRNDATDTTKKSASTVTKSSLQSAEKRTIVPATKVETVLAQAEGALVEPVTEMQTPVEDFQSQPVKTPAEEEMDTAETQTTMISPVLDTKGQMEVPVATEAEKTIQAEQVMETSPEPVVAEEKAYASVGELRRAYKQKDYKHTLELAMVLAESNNLDANKILAEMYANGNGVKASIRKAANHYKMAAQQGDLDSQVKIAFYYIKGKGVKQNSAKSFYWFKKAARQNHALAQYHVGDMYRNGRGVKQNHKLAVKYFTRSARQGNIKSAYYLGLMYQKGLGVQQDLITAHNWYSKAANKDHIVAQKNLALLYLRGKGVAQDNQKALYWLEKSAHSDNVEAQLKLAQLYEYGGVDIRNISKAIRWYKRAAKKDNRTAIINLDRIKRRITAVKPVDTVFEDDEAVTEADTQTAVNLDEPVFE